MGSSLKSLVVCSSLFTAAFAHYAHSHNGTYSNSTTALGGGHGKGDHDHDHPSVSVAIVTVIVSKPVATICDTSSLGYTGTYTSSASGSSVSGVTVSTSSSVWGSSTSSGVVTSSGSSSSVSTSSGRYYNTTSSATSSVPTTSLSSTSESSTSQSSGTDTSSSVTSSPTSLTGTPSPTPSSSTSCTDSSSTQSPTPTSSSSSSVTPSPTPSSSSSSSETPTPTPSSSSVTPTPTPSSSETPTPTPSSSSVTPTPTPSSSSSETPTPTPTPSSSSSSESSSTPTPTPSSSSSSVTPTPTPSSSSSSTPSPTPSSSSSSVTPTPTPSPSSVTPTPTPSSSSSSTPSPTPTPTPSSSSTSSSSTSSPTPTQTACAYWMENISHQGIVPFNTDTTYKVFRNVKDYGAKGDGKTDDTDAINLAISSANRCDPKTCTGSTTTPAVVYFPAGTYLVSNPIVDYYYTQLIGNPNCMPVIQASSSFTQRWVIDGDQYQSTGKEGWNSTNVFYRQIRNFVIDMTAVSPDVLIAGIHWPTAQATSLQNIKVEMSTVSGNQQEGIFIEDGSGGFIADLVFNGGLHGITVGNQQFTMRNLTITNAATAIYQSWSWGWTYQGITIDSCGLGLDMTNIAKDGSQAVASVTFLDSTIKNTPVFVSMARDSTSTYPSDGSLVLENVILQNVAQAAVLGPNSFVVLAGTADQPGNQATIAGWAQGHSYTPSSTGPTTIQGTIVPRTRPTDLTSGTAYYYERSKPQYEGYPASSFVSVRTAGAKGDGVTDDSTVLNTILASAAASGKIVYFDAGDYLVTKTVFVPAGSRIVGETYSVILSSGSFFNSMSSPKPVVQIGLPGQGGSIEWSDMIVSTQGAQAGAILIEYNLASTSTAPSGIWDVHTRIGGFAGSDLQLANCPVTSTTPATQANININCIAAFLSFHVTPLSSGLYLENVWLWVADHDIEDAKNTQITIYAGRGLLIESTTGNIWAYGTAAEHHVFYQYQLSNTQNAVLGQIQTETAYYQPNPVAPLPFIVNAAYNDPDLVAAGEGSGYGLRIVGSKKIFVNGAGLYSFFENNDVHCSDQGGSEDCQTTVFSVESSSAITVYNLNTVGTTSMITVNNAVVAKYSDNIGGFIDTIALFTV